MRILSEGKVVNNKPYFDICRINGKPTGKKAKPGQELSMSNTYDWDLGGNARSHGIEKQYFSPEQKAYINAHTGDDGEFHGDIEEFDEESFDELSESYLKKVYSNVDGYKTSNVSFNKSGLCVEGIISFKSGNKKNTQFIFESRDNGKRFVGENKQITRGKKAFTVKGSIKDGKFITESFNYRYSAINPRTGKSENLYETLKRGK